MRADSYRDISVDAEANPARRTRRQALGKMEMRRVKNGDEF